jgi:hypothetical protein
VEIATPPPSTPSSLNSRVEEWENDGVKEFVVVVVVVGLLLDCNQRQPSGASWLIVGG